MAYDVAAQNVLSLAGAVYDIAGATLLGRALIFVKARGLYRQASSGYGGLSLPLLKMFAEQKADAIFGLAALVFGFFLQGTASFGFHYNLRSSGACILVIVLAVALALCTICYFTLRHRLTKWFFCSALRSDPHPVNQSQPRLPENTIEKLWSDAQADE
jgi:hypothetical protein